MANKNPLNKNSQYVESLVSFILDTKPYHSKLTEVVEEYQFFDDVKVKFDERFMVRAKLASTWLYNYYSGANPEFRTLPLQRLVSPSYVRDTFIAGQDENTDLALVPRVYSKRNFQGPGVNAVYVKRAGSGAVEPLTESVDYYQSHGSFQFQIKQTLNANGDFVPLWQSRQDDGAISAASAATRSNALNESNPNSAVRRLRTILDGVQAAKDEGAPDDEDVQRELDALYAIIDIPDLPQSYEALLAYLGLNPLILVDREELENQFHELSSPLYFGQFTDLGIRESGLVNYDPVENAYIRVYDIIPNIDGQYEEWELLSIDDDTSSWRVSGSTSGFVGFVSAGETFTSAGKISFKVQAKAQPPIGERLSFAPDSKIAIHQSAPLETWNIIKTNPVAHTRPYLNSAHYGKIQDLSGNLGKVTLLDQAMPTSEIVLEARADGKTFDLTSTEAGYSGVVTAGVPFNDGRLGFLVSNHTYRRGDRFYISIENLPARAENLDLGYGYDLDAYDNDHLEDDQGRKINFAYDGRFTDYDVNLLNLNVAQSAVNGRKWRIRALPSANAIATIKKDGSGPNLRIDLTDATSGTAPDPALTAPPVYSMAGDANTEADLYLYYADTFRVEYSDNDFATVVSAGNVAVGATFNSAQHGISFTLTPASKPFIAVSSDDGLGQPRVEGGDVISFSIVNPLPTLKEDPIALSSTAIPRLIMHSDSFFYAAPAKWTVTMTSATEYSVSAVQTGTNAGITLPGTPFTGTLPAPGLIAAEGNSVKQLDTHFTFVPSMGLYEGDVFTFETFEQKPSYMVYGSVTGFTGFATVGKYFWNGKIGFKIPAPEVNVYKDNQLVNPLGHNITIDRLREDTPSLVYIITKAVNGGYMITRTDAGIIGFAPREGVFNDQYVRITFDAPSFQELKILVDAHDYNLFNGQDLVILRSVASARHPVAGDKVIIEKTEKGRLGLSLTPGLANLSDLNPITIDQRFIDLDTHQPIPLSATSPETSILQGWIPMYVESHDSATSIAEFSDPATSHVFKSSFSGVTIGTLKQQTENRNEPIVFEWDADFFANYLPLNAEANITLSGTGWDDRTRVNISESVKFLIGGGALTEDWLFRDMVSTNVTEDHSFAILQNNAGDMFVEVEDGPFDGFLSGYDNQGYDDEQNGYDEGQAPDIYSLLKRYDLTEQERQDIFDRWNFYLSSDEAPTTEQQWEYFRNKLIEDPNPGVRVDGFGYPVIGLGMDIVEKPVNSASASIQEAMIVMANDLANGHDTLGYGLGSLDKLGDSSAIMYSGSLPPIPTNVPPGTTFDSLDTPLTAEVPARVFEITFNASTAALQALNPQFSIWLPDAPAAQLVPVVEKVSLGKYRFSIPAPSRAKILVG